MYRWMRFLFVYLMGWLPLVAAGQRDFRVFWNVPSVFCNKFDIYINVSQWGIIQNTDDVFLGDKMTIVYGSGRFPYFNGTVPVRGGIPQNADVVEHLNYFRQQVQLNIPEDFHGVASLDFEKYQPILKESPIIYESASLQWAKKKYPNLPKKIQQIVSEVGFETSAKMLFQSLLVEGSRLRPKAVWGYYHYPFCRNPIPGKPECNANQILANQKTSWLYKNSGAYFPSIYIFKNGWSTEERRLQVVYRLLNSMSTRTRNNDEHKPIFPYFWFKYHDESSTFITDRDIVNTIVNSKTIFKLDGIVIWGATDDVNSKQKCLQLQEFMEQKLGPIVKTLV